MDSLLVKVVLQFLYTVLTLFRGGVHTSPTSLHLALMRLLSLYGTGRFSPERKKPAALLQRVSLIRSQGALRSRMS